MNDEVNNETADMRRYQFSLRKLLLLNVWLAKQAMSNMQSALAEIQRHGCLSENASSDGFCSVIFDARIQRRPGRLDLRSQFRDVLRSLEIINREINGAVPSTTFERKQSIDIAIVAAMQDIIHTGLDWCHFQRGRISANIAPFDHEVVVVWAISYCWMAIMHGDIDSLESDLKAELAVRGISTDVLWTVERDT